MTGIFDSGVGGLTALERLRFLKPSEDICYLADRINAPYGNKNESQLIPIVENDIKRLRDAGCGIILAACCTASTVIPRLSDEFRRGVVQIISSAAQVAVNSGARKIGVIATDATVRCCAFEKEIRKLDGSIEVISRSAQPLVAMVEDGERDNNCSPECLNYLTALLKDFDLARSNLSIPFLTISCNSSGLKGFKIYWNKLHLLTASAIISISEKPVKRILITSGAIKFASSKNFVPSIIGIL